MAEVRITWTDSGTFRAGDEWTSEESLTAKSKIGTVVTTGRLVAANEESIMVGLSNDPDSAAWFGVQEIQTRAIEKIERLRVRDEISLEDLIKDA